MVAVEIDTYKQTRVSSSAFGSGMLKKEIGSTREWMGETSFDKTRSLPTLSIQAVSGCRSRDGGASSAQIAGSASMFADHRPKTNGPLAYKRLILEIRSVTYPSWLLTRDVEMDVLLAGG